MRNTTNHITPNYASNAICVASLAAYNRPIVTRSGYTAISNIARGTNIAIMFSHNVIVFYSLREQTKKHNTPAVNHGTSAHQRNNTSAPGTAYSRGTSALIAAFVSLGNTHTAAAFVSTIAVYQCCVTSLVA